MHATSLANPARFAELTLEVTAGMALGPPARKLVPGELCSFAATLPGQAGGAQSLDWSAEAGLIEPNGDYTAP